MPASSFISRLSVVALAAAAALALLAIECSPAADQATIQILTVDDPFEPEGGPAASEITVQTVAYDDGGAGGAVTTIAKSAYAGAGSLNLGTFDESNTESILVTANDVAGNQVAWGETLAVELGALAGEALGVFVQRAGTLSRMPTALADGRQSPIVGVLGGRYIFVAGGTGSGVTPAQSELYDLIAWAPLGSPPVLPVSPQSVAFAQLQALLISSTGAAWYDLTESTTDDASLPTAPIGTTDSWGSIAGGATIVTTDESCSYVVGGTRAAGPATNGVLQVCSGGTLSWTNLQTERLGAAAAWLDGVGAVVVEGGNTTAGGPDGGGSDGLELVYRGGPSGSSLGYPNDTSTGSGMAPLDTNHVIVVGGTTARVFTVPCGTLNTPACTITTWPLTLPTPLTFAQVFDIDANDVFVVGEDASGAMHAYRLSDGSQPFENVVEVPFRVPRNHARAVRLPFGAPGAGPVAVVGGDPNIESFIP